MMEQAVKVGKHYAYRAKLSRSEPFQKVKVVEKVGRKGMVKIRFEEEPHPGLRSTSVAAI